MGKISVVGRYFELQAETPNFWECINVLEDGPAGCFGVSISCDNGYYVLGGRCVIDMECLSWYEIGPDQFNDRMREIQAFAEKLKH